MQRAQSYRPTRSCTSALLAALLVPASLVHAAPPESVIEQQFWGDLYKNGGTTLFCNQPFERKSVALTEGYIYPLNWIRDHLQCRSHRQCLSENERYARIIADFHNIVPEETRFELKRRNTKYEDLGERVAQGDCELRAAFQAIEPADRIKGDVARALLYMQTVWDLPGIAPLEALKRWNHMDPPDTAEIERNAAIKRIQGTENAFITDPSLADSLQ